ncbi:unnamed protein product [Didymodactylos carnosus]|uniref:Uncharacterized protein n=1 Tax=Didymodactylos carnosus TaxID=1234261 RepID=A0A815C7J1_9BILA|nr:unnamed protein product [Didymodactylos carnosus]CAF1281444.1 unnamed protein product [Didymodactylos carnosus]CAF3850217.1 unnamed protein product [Didymodactylos carnosus]CAF4077185.1 unnamed protein product [Didymodactylos carnosus]
MGITLSWLVIIFFLPDKVKVFYCGLIGIVGRYCQEYQPQRFIRYIASALSFCLLLYLNITLWELIGLGLLAITMNLTVNEFKVFYKSKI